MQVIDDSSGELNKYYYKLGQHFVSLQDYKAAEKFYMRANMHKQVKLATVLPMRLLNPWVNPTIGNYNTGAGKIYNAMSRLVG
jgi:hypothetical protein